MMVVSAATQPYQLWMTGNGAILDDMGADPVGCCTRLEQGGILYFPVSPFHLSAPEREFLLSQKQLETAYHKNIAYRPLQRKLTGVKADANTDVERLKTILDDYARQTAQWIQTFLSPYQSAWRYDYTSFRPVEEDGRKLRVRAQNDLLHVDSFPTRPTHGARILRVFTNINPSQDRVWQTGQPFGPLASRFKADMTPYHPQNKNILQRLGINWPVRPAYDRWMMAFHNFLKENTAYQQTTPKATWTFPPGSAWAVYTDTVSHAVLSGQYALEQTFMIDPHGMVSPEDAPIHILEKLYAA